MSDALFQIENLSFSYNHSSPSQMGEETLIIDKLTLEKGKIITFRGHNGSGKTTLLKLLAELITPDSGSIDYLGEGRPILVHQQPYLFHGTVRQNLLYPLRFRSVPEADRHKQILRVLQMVGLKGFEKRKARELSGGEKKRVAIARALVTKPSVLLLDEPDANVDSRTSLELEKLLIDLQRSGISIILSTHDNSLAYKISDEIIDLYRGKPVDHHENIFRGSFQLREEIHSQFKSDQILFLCPSRKGHYSTAVISSKDIYLSKDRIPKGDYNQLDGVIRYIAPFKEDRFILTVDCGIQIQSQISSTALDLLEGKVGDKVIALFSPSAVHLY